MHNSEEKNEAFKAFKDLLVPIVRDALQQNEAIDRLYWAAHYAYALQDMVAGKRLMPKILEKRDAEYVEYGAAGLLAVMIGANDLAENIIQVLEIIDEYWSRPAAVEIALNLPDKTTAKRLMRKYESQSKRGSGLALKIAAEIGDKESIERWMQQMFDEDQSLQQLIDEGQTEGIDSRCLMKAVLFTPEFGKRLMKRIEHEDHVLLLALAGEIAAILGDRTYARMVFEYFQEKESYFKLKAGAIATALGDINATEEMICKVFSSRFDWDHSYSEEVGDILTNLAKQNPKAAEKIWKIVEKEVPAEFYLVTVAARILKILPRRGSSNPVLRRINFSFRFCGKIFDKIISLTVKANPAKAGNAKLRILVPPWRSKDPRLPGCLNNSSRLFCADGPTSF